MENMEYYKVLEETLKLEINEKLLFIYNLMKKVVSEIEVAIEEERNLMISPSVNHKTLDILELYSKMLEELKEKEVETNFDINTIHQYISESNILSIEEKTMLIYNLIESIKFYIIGEFSKKFKLEDFNKSRSIEINKSLLKITKNYIQQYSQAIKSAFVLENKLDKGVGLIVAGDHLLR